MGFLAFGPLHALKSRSFPQRSPEKRTSSPDEAEISGVELQDEFFGPSG